MVIDTRARLGYTAAHRVDGRVPCPAPDRRPAPAARRPTVRRPAGWRRRPAAEAIAADTLREVYFEDGGRRAGSLEGVRFTDIEHLACEL
ncbi:hypothetical protein GCM10010261_61780 [Streptomyces pilosus]|nr:hypothetical protein GCM10010261_61780 [Streptomyces pilosus]